MDTVLTYIQKIKSQMPFLINLSKEEKKKLAKMNERRRPFAQKALEYAKSEPGPIPRNLDLKKMELDLNTYLKLRRIHREIRKLDEMLRDTIAIKGAYSYSTACKIYNAFEMGRGSETPGIDSIFDDLTRHFTQGRKDSNGAEMIDETDEDNQ